MATYKVIQDIEAEDKLIWVFSFRQFVYLLIAVLFLYISFLFFVKHVAFMDILTMPVSLFTGILAFPFGKDQPTEVWVLAKIRFFVKPKIRIWSQSGTKELVTINVPKTVQADLTDGLSQNEVKSRLEALATTIDTRGWSIKNSSNPYVSPLTSSSNSSDRLISPVVTANVDDVYTSEDILDSDNNPLAQKMTEMITVNDEQRHKALMEKLNSIKSSNSINSPTTNEEKERELIKEAKINQNLTFNNLRRVSKSNDPKISTGNVNQVKSEPSKEEPPKPKSPDIIDLSKRNDLNVTVISHEANRKKTSEDLKNSDERVISLR